MYAIRGDFRRFCFDRAVITFGMALEAELDSVEGKNDKAINAARSRMLDTWLGRPLKFRSPSGATASGASKAESMTISGDGSGGVL